MRFGEFVLSGEKFAVKILDRSVLFRGLDKLVGKIPSVSSVEKIYLSRYPSTDDLSVSACEERAVRRLRRLVNEIEVLKYLKDTPNLSHFYGCYISPRRIYVALNFVKDHVDLFEYVVSFYPLKDSVLKYIFKRICQIVHTIHELG